MPPLPSPGSKFLRVGAPLLILVTGGWFCLTSVIAGKIEVKAARDRAIELTGPQSKRRPTSSVLDLEAEAARLTDALSLGKPFDNKPVPRPKGW